MDPTYHRYAQTHPLFYDTPSRRPVPRTRALRPHDDDSSWTGWQHLDDGHWVFHRPEGATLPEQGWKIHVTASEDNARQVLAQVSAYCRAHDIVFKHLPDLDTLTARNAKDADRSTSGKFITLYPVDEDTLRRVLDDLDAVLGGTPGPYVLSDLRWNAGPLFVRYGAFTRTWTRDEHDRPVLALREPTGHLVEDRRTASFTPPPWVTVPAFLREQLDALGGSAPPADFAYRPTRALHYSNAGGVYEATDPTGARVVLKEARPHAGLTPDGRDAVARLVDEEAALLALAGPDVVAVRDSLTVQGHRFLVLDHVDGTTVSTQVVARCPAVRADAAPADRLAYRQWALDVDAQVRRAVARIHAAGYVHGDLHPGNVLLTPGGQVVLLDLEMARTVEGRHAPVIGAPGFVAPDGRGGVAADRYALACLTLFLFCPLTTLLGLDPLKLDELLDWARDTYGLDEELLASVRADLALPGRERLDTRSRLAQGVDHAIRRWDTSTEDAVLALQVLVSRSIAASADFARTDRAWPGDPQQFAENGWNLAHGAAGVLHALDACSLDIDPQGLEWFDAATRGGTGVDGSAPVAAGLFDGLAGAAWVQRRLGHDAQADRLLDELLRLDTGALGADLYGGLPGVGLYLLSEAAHDPTLIDRAEQIARRLRARHDERPPLDPREPDPVVRTGQGGLLRGPSGTALFALELYRHTGDLDHLALARDALDHDLAHCVVAPDGSLQVNEGWRLMPYLATGSAGIGLVAAQLVHHVPEPGRYLLALDGISAAARAPFVIEPGLFHGRAGLIHYLVTLARLGLSTPRDDAALRTHVDALRLHAVRHGTGIGFPGQGLLRLSSDLATGAAGVLTALQAHTMLNHDDARTGWNTLLPLLLPGCPPARPGTPAAPAVPHRGGGDTRGLPPRPAVAR
ncbi:class III lanthionine synthetase LanKC [Cellulomonas soli]|uniref:non-specific serine/threonine protein kinase n=1 Tax=Cellulomonas soli TaxID=931535 RepID=A0A512P9B0_9CELL|nr:class III lanthionine synthetase LanKC [Cellulomonas soli]NYI60278.1 serine/threonine protein kinase [Cellulomonas soli]GEP67789.1 serine/threonine protein kinase [Cellulomonas soli]